ncbi:N-acetylmuramoyl-L-alanine amidase, partial [Staphylococcus epidermidis]
KKPKNKMPKGKKPTKKLVCQHKKIFASRAELFGTNKLNRHGGKGNYSWNMMNTTYGKGP